MNAKANRTFVANFGFLIMQKKFVMYPKHAVILEYPEKSIINGKELMKKMEKQLL